MLGLEIAFEVGEAERREVGADPLADPPFGLRSMHTSGPAEFVLEVLCTDPSGAGAGSQVQAKLGLGKEGGWVGLYLGGWRPWNGFWASSEVVSGSLTRSLPARCSIHSFCS